MSELEARRGNLDDAFIGCSPHKSQRPRGKETYATKSGGMFSRQSRTQLAALLKVQAKLTLREPYPLSPASDLPIDPAGPFRFHRENRSQGMSAGSGLTVIDLYVPDDLVISLSA